MRLRKTNSVQEQCSPVEAQSIARSVSVLEPASCDSFSQRMPAGMYKPFSDSKT